MSCQKLTSASGTISCCSHRNDVLQVLSYLGVRRLLSHDEHRPVAGEHRRLHRVFCQGTLVAVLNPKTALFFLAFLPQFIDASRGAVWEQALVLGLTFVDVGVCTDSVYALVTGRRAAGCSNGQASCAGSATSAAASTWPSA